MVYLIVNTKDRSIRHNSVFPSLIEAEKFIYEFDDWSKASIVELQLDSEHTICGDYNDMVKAYPIAVIRNLSVNVVD